MIMLLSDRLSSKLRFFHIAGRPLFLRMRLFDPKIEPAVCVGATGETTIVDDDSPSATLRATLPSTVSWEDPRWSNAFQVSVFKRRKQASAILFSYSMSH